MVQLTMHYKCPDWGQNTSEEQGELYDEYRQVYNISCTKSQNWSDSRPVLELSLLNLLKPRVKSCMKI